MANKHTEFWLALLDQDKDTDQRTRLWNGYLGWKLPPRIKGEGKPQTGWPKLIVDPPNGGWPELTEGDKNMLDGLASTHGGHPQFSSSNYMDFGNHTFSEGDVFSKLILVDSDFSNAQFKNEMFQFDDTQFYCQTPFFNATFEGIVHFHKVRFDAPVYFGRSHFNSLATFMGVEFMGGASFNHVLFNSQVMFNDSRFEERYFSGNSTVPILADFTNAKFMAKASFREVLFGNDESAYSRTLWPERRVDFTNAEFMDTTDFRKAIFGGAPAFFNATLHEDTDFGGVDWKKAETSNISVDYAIRAWERLELIMSRLEKPLDRHLFFRLKMRDYKEWLTSQNAGNR